MKRATDYLKSAHAALTQEGITRLLGEAMRREGVPYAVAHKDAEGFCLTCGCGLLCPGVHTLEEIQEAGRRDNSRTGRDVYRRWEVYA